LAGVAPVLVGRTDSRLGIQAGPWTFTLPIDASARYPNVREVIPRVQDCTTRLRLDAADAALLLKALPGLPGKEEDLSPITLDAGNPPAIRAAASGGAIEEVALTRLVVSGPPVRLVTNRRYLHRALRLGFMEIELRSKDRPLVCRDGPRIYLWMSLSQVTPLAPLNSSTSRSEVAVPNGTVASPKRRTLMRRSLPPSNAPIPGNGGVPAGPPVGGLPEPDLESILAEGEALRGLLHEAQGRAGRLLAGLKHYRRQAKAFETALASLRPFQRSAGGAP
jgi:hypothetical protein